MALPFAAVHYVPCLPAPVVSTSELCGQGARGGLREGVSYTWSLAADHAAGVARIESPLTQTNEFDDYGRPTFPEQEDALRDVLARLGVASVSRWTTTTEIALADLPRVHDGLAALLDQPRRTRASEWHRGEVLVAGRTLRASVAFYDPAPDAPTHELAVSCAPAERDAATALLRALAPGAAVIDDPAHGRVVAALPADLDAADLRATLRKRFPPR